MRYNNFDMFKFLIRKSADLSTILKFASVELILDIVNDKSDSFQTLISNKSKINHKNLEESLFFGKIFNQELIVRLLVDNNVTPYYFLGKWRPIFVAAKLDYTVA